MSRSNVQCCLFEQEQNQAATAFLATTSQASHVGYIAMRQVKSLGSRGVFLLSNTRRVLRERWYLRCMF